MHKSERGMIKWMPFNSVVPNKEVVNSVLKEKNKIDMPSLCEEQKDKIEKQILLKYYAKEKVYISYYFQGRIITTYEKIKKIDPVFHKIYLENHILLFDQIVKVNS